MIKIESNTGLGNGTTVMTEDGHEITGITRVDIGPLQMGTPARATLTFEFLDGLEVVAEPYVTLEMLGKLAQQYGLALLPMPDEDFARLKRPGKVRGISPLTPEELRDLVCIWNGETMPVTDGDQAAMRQVVDRIHWLLNRRNLGHGSA